MRNERERHLSIAMCVIAVACPLIFVATVSAEPREPMSTFVTLAFLVVILLTILSAFTSYLKDLRFYSKNSLDVDSAVDMHLKFPGGAKGARRLLFYYPFTFFSASFGLAAVIVFLR